jgi:hypothetical protein
MVQMSVKVPGQGEGGRRTKEMAASGLLQLCHPLFKVFAIVIGIVDTGADVVVAVVAGRF